MFLDPAFTWSFMPFVAFTVAYYLLSLTVNAGTRGFDQAAHVESVSAWHPASYPSLDVFFPVCGEPLTVLRNTWEHVAKLARAYPGTATVYVLDDGTDDRVRVLASAFGFSWIARPDRGWMKKAGNLRHGFTRSGGEFILILDADFAPQGRSAPRDAPVLRHRTLARHRAVPAVFPHPRAHVWMNGRRRGPGTVLPAGAGLP